MFRSDSSLPSYFVVYVQSVKVITDSINRVVNSLTASISDPFSLSRCEINAADVLVKVRQTHGISFSYDRDFGETTSCDFSWCIY